MTENKKYGFGIVGCGMISRWHANAVSLIDDAELVGVADRRPEKAKAFAQENNCIAFETYEQMLSCDKIDVICICTPSGLHAPMAVMAAKAKKHFVVEKPMAITKEQIEDVIEACEENGVKGAVISQLRFTESIKYVKNAIENGELGDIIIADVYMKYYRSPEYYASAEWRGTWELDGGGALMNQGIHGIDVLQYLAGEVKSVSAICKTLARDIDVEDTANVLVEYKNGAIGTIQGTTSVNPGYPRVISISGTKGTVELTEDVITRWDIEGKSGPPENMPKGNINSYRDPAGFALDTHKMQICDLIDAIKQDRRPLVDVYEGKKPVDIILSAYQSSRMKKTVFL